MTEGDISPTATGLRDRGEIAWLYVLALMAVVAVGVLVRLAVLAPVDADEVEHAHAAWLVATGHRPYLDFHQIHMPLVWLVAAPVAALVSTPSLLIVALRFICITALFAALMLGYSATAGSMSRRERWIAALIATIWAVVFAGATQFYRFRPDPFMAAAVMGAIAIYARPGGTGLRRHAAAGFCLGLAAAFSPKVLPLVFLAPAVAVLDATRGPRRLARATSACAAAAAGAAIVPLLVVAVLGAMDLLQPFYYWVVTQNATMVNGSVTTTRLVILLVMLGGAVAAGAGVTSWWWRRSGRDTVRPLAVVSIAVALGAFVPIIEPNHSIYNYQTDLVPAGLALGLTIAALTGTGRWAWLRVVSILSLTAICVIPLADSWQLRKRGTPPTLASKSALDKLSQCGNWSHDTCVGFAPDHPVSCPDATALTQMWDYGFMVGFPSVPESTRAVYEAMWRDAIPRMVAAPPAIVVRPDYFRLVADRGRLDATSYATLQRLFADRYRQANVAGVEVMVRNDRVACLDP